MMNHDLVIILVLQLCHWISRVTRQVQLSISPLDPKFNTDDPLRTMQIGNLVFWVLQFRRVVS